MENNRFIKKFKGKTDEQLNTIASEESFHADDAKAAAVYLLEKRAQGNGADVERVVDLDSMGFEEITDTKKPVLYSKRAINAFSILFSTLFGAVLLFMNAKRVQPKHPKYSILGVGLLYTVGAIYLINQMELPSSASIALNGIGGFILNGYFWNRVIGEQTLYMPRSWWQPLLIGGSITVLLMLNLIYA